MNSLTFLKKTIQNIDLSRLKSTVSPILKLFNLEIIKKITQVNSIVTRQDEGKTVRAETTKQTSRWTRKTGYLMRFEIDLKCWTKLSVHKTWNWKWKEVKPKKFFWLFCLKMIYFVFESSLFIGSVSFLFYAKIYKLFQMASRLFRPFLDFVSYYRFFSPFLDAFFIFITKKARSIIQLKN